MIDRENRDMEQRWAAIADVSRLPDALFVVDVKTEKTAVTEGRWWAQGGRAVRHQLNPTDVAYVSRATTTAAKTIRAGGTPHVHAGEGGRPRRSRQLRRPKRRRNSVRRNL